MVKNFLKKTFSSGFLGMYMVIPILALSQVPQLFYSTDLLRLSNLLFFTLIVLLCNYKYLQINQLIQAIPILLILIYSFNQLILGNDLTSFLLGRFNRYGGIISLICFSIFYILSSNTNLGVRKDFIKSLYVAYMLLMVYGVLTATGLADYLLNFNVNESKPVVPNALSLTFGNPNMASAFLGMCISMHLFLILFKEFKANMVQIPLLITNIYLLYCTKSIQGWLILSINLSLYLFLIIRRKKKSLNIKSFLLFALLTIPSIVLIVYNLPRLKEIFIIGGHAEARINYWKASLRIWNEHLFTGVGIDNLGEYSTFYRDQTLAKQEGIWTIPDRTHNVVLDHLVNGGIFAGLIWLIFIVTVSIQASKIIFKDRKSPISIYDFSVVIIWVGYLIQSLLSVDHIILTLIGYCSAGLIVSKNVEDMNAKISNMYKKIYSIASILILLMIFTLYQIRLDYSLNQFLKIGKSENLERIYNAKFIDQQSLLDVVVKVTADKQFKLASLLGDKLLKLNSYAHQAYYAKSVFLESEGEIYGAKVEMEKAHMVDKYNSVYTLSIGIYEFNLKNYSKAKFWLNETISLNPNQQGIENLQRSLSDKLN